MSCGLTLRGAVSNSQSDDSVVVGCPSFPPGVLCASEPLLARNSSSKESASASSTSSSAAAAVSGDSVWFGGLGVGLSVCIVIRGGSWLSDNSSLSHVLAASIVVGEESYYAQRSYSYVMYNVLIPFHFRSRLI